MRNTTKTTTDEKHGLTGNQAWRMVPTTGGIQFVNEMTNNCLVALHAPGYTVGLDAGLKVIAAQTAECDKSASQLFVRPRPVLEQRQRFRRSS